MLIRFFKICLLFYGPLLFSLLFNDSAIGQGWTDLKIRLLPDSSFAVIETDPVGQKHRQCAHHDLNGKLDQEQLLYAIGTISREKWIDQKNKKYALKHLEKHYDRMINEQLKNERIEPVNINTAKLTQLDIPLDSGHPFRCIPATYSGAFRPPVPEQIGHLVIPNN